MAERRTLAATARRSELSPVAARTRGLWHRYGSTVALEGIDLEVATGTLAGVIGPDGVGKSTLLGLLAGARKIQRGRVELLGHDLRRPGARRRGVASTAYMAQGLGANLYPELSVRENIGYFARLYQIPRRQAAGRIDQLLEITGLDDKLDRRVHQLSGGMKQKLGLCCALVHSPRFLVLDEPTTGVDPVSRRVFWELLERLRAGDPGLTVIVATAYMEEAEPFDDLTLLKDGRVVARGSAPQLCRRSDANTLEEAYARLVAGEGRASPLPSAEPASRLVAGGASRAREPAAQRRAPAIEALELTRRFGPVLAVDRASFRIERGEIFGFVGPNGSGKTTTLKMLTGILPPSAGEARLLGERVSGRSLEQRRRTGYMSQSFSLYRELTVVENLRLYGRLLDVTGSRLVRRSAELTRDLGLGGLSGVRVGTLPLGLRQRLALATALIHDPQVLVLDEPTSGVDPLARERFWGTIEDLARRQGVTVLVSTHYLTEAARCDRVALMSSGRVLACDEPGSLIRAVNARTLEDAFVAWIRADPARGQASFGGSSR